jgi:hypothetical protein
VEASVNGREQIQNHHNKAGFAPITSIAANLEPFLRGSRVIRWDIKLQADCRLQRLTLTALAGKTPASITFSSPTEVCREITIHDIWSIQMIVRNGTGAPESARSDYDVFYDAKIWLMAGPLIFRNSSCVSNRFPVTSGRVLSNGPLISSVSQRCLVARLYTRPVLRGFCKTGTRMQTGWCLPNVIRCRSFKKEGCCILNPSCRDFVWNTMLAGGSDVMTERGCVSVVQDLMSKHI